MDEAARKDLDETRRLLYMALVFSRTDGYEVAATLINTLKHHQGVDPAEDAPEGHASAELVDRVVNYVNGQGGSDEWLIAQIVRVTKQGD